MVGITGNKKLDQKGYLLIESLVAFSIVSLCIAIYIPFIVNMLQKINAEKTAVDMYRIQYEQLQKMEQHQSTDKIWKTGGEIFTIEETVTNTQKGVRIKHDEEEIFIEVRSFQTSSP